MAREWPRKKGIHRSTIAMVGPSNSDYSRPIDGGQMEIGMSELPQAFCHAMGAPLVEMIRIADAGSRLEKSSRMPAENAGRG